jgi:cholesterol oxidase
MAPQSFFAALALLTLVTASPTAQAQERTRRALPVADGGDAHPSGHRRLSDAIEGLQNHYEVLVIGTGYGAAVAGMRTAEAMDPDNTGAARGRIAFFERGREWMPGDFPEGLSRMLTEVRSPLNPLGLLDFNSHATRGDMDVIGASGLGGTSLLNAAIALRPADNVWEQPEWPAAVRADFANGTLGEAYDRAEAMLRPNLDPPPAPSPG